MITSSGLLVYRTRKQQLEVFLVHPGGPFWKNKDLGAWSVPKGIPDEHEDLLEAAKREFKEETGSEIEGDFMALSPIKQKNGKTVYAWAVEGDIDPATVQSNMITIEWPPKTGKTIEIPEVDRGEWFVTDEAKLKINPKQAPFIDELIRLKK